MTPLAQEKKVTYADLLEWDDDVRYELYDGQPVALAAPESYHQEISMALSAQFYSYLKDKKCKVYAAPFNVRLFEQEGDSLDDVEYVLEPDITVVCDLKKIDRRGCKGAPDLVIEILSPSTRRHDRLTKYNLYLRAGVREYWIVDPETKTVSVHALTEGQYGSPDVYTQEASVPVGVLEGCVIDLPSVFA